MEPEVAFVMANLARVRPGSRVLDPTCGSGGLLVAAAALGATELRGVDQNASAFAGAVDDFGTMALPVPTFVCGDVLSPDGTAALAASSRYDAILSDPPYNLRAPVLVDGAAADAHDPQPAADLTASVIRLAEEALAPNGRLVLFVPARGAEIELSLPALLRRRLHGHAGESCNAGPTIPGDGSSAPGDGSSTTLLVSSRLRLVCGRLQRFSTRRSRRAGSSATPRASNGPGAFARWLVCLEKTPTEAPEVTLPQPSGEELPTTSSTVNDSSGGGASSAVPHSPTGTGEDPARSSGGGLLSSVKECADDWQRAVALVRAAPPPADVYAASAAMSACARAGEWRAAVALLDALPSPDSACFHAALRACETAPRADASAASACAFGLLECMTSTSADTPPAASSYTTAGKAALRAGDWRAALAAYDAMLARGLTPHHTDHKAAVNAAVRGRQWERVAAIAAAATAASDGSGGVRAASRRAWLWRAWSDAQLRRMSTALDARLAARVHRGKTQALQRALTAAAASGEMPSFSDGGARAGYALAHLPSRARKVADTLRLDEPPWLRGAMDEALNPPGRVVVSLGGGPGFDVASLGLLHAFGSAAAAAAHNDEEEGDDGAATDAAPMPAPRPPPPAARVLVLDYEAGWADEVDAVASAAATVLGAQSTPPCAFGAADITRSVTDAANTALLAALPDTRLLIASYVVAENALALDAGGYAFFESLFRQAAPGSTLLVLETTHRAFAALVAAARRGADGALQVGCTWVHSNNGHSLLLRKVAAGAGEADSAARREEVDALLERFEADRQSHERRSREPS